MITYTVDVTDYSTKWYLNGVLHREDGPAITLLASGNKYWYRNGQVHRMDGPAIESACGAKYWYQNNKSHREDGPAIEYPNGNKSWYLYGEELTEEQFNARMNPVKELTVAEIEKLLGYSVKVVK